MPLTKQPPLWGGVGEAPPQQKIESGWAQGERPPAAWFNWFFHLTAEAFAELYAKVALLEDTGDTAGLTTSTKATLVAAVNELVTRANKLSVDLGNKASLTTSNKTNLVAALNELVTNVGNKASLTTSAKNSLVAALNELVTRANTLSADLGNKTSLTTSNKANLVAALNELVTNVGNKASLTTSDKTNLVAALNELVGIIGNLSDLTSEDKTSLVAAINEAATKGSSGEGADGRFTKMWNAKDICGPNTSATASASGESQAESGYYVALDTVGKSVNGGAANVSLPYGTYVAIFRMMTTSLAGNTDKVRLEMFGLKPSSSTSVATSIATKYIKQNDFSAANQWEYFKVPFNLDSTSGRNVYPVATCVNATGVIRLDTVLVAPNAFALM